MSTRWALGGQSGTWHSEGTWTLRHSEGTRRVLRNQGTLGTQALEHVGNWALRTYRHLGTQGTQALRHFNTRGTLFSRLEIEYVINYQLLVYISDDDIRGALIPFHLLHGRNLLTYKVNNDCVIKNERTFHISKRFRKQQIDLNNYLSYFREAF